MPTNNNIIKRLKNLGPGALVAAAFIGPGTITTCTLAGVQFGYALLWALIFATLATIILQEMAARLGVITQKGLGEVLNHIFLHSIWKWPLYLLILIAICLGNAAYEAGNLSGAALGIAAVMGNGEGIYSIAVIITSIVAALLLWFGSYKQIEKVLLTLVILMTLAFSTTFIIVKPDLIELIQGFVIQIPGGSLTTVVALIGTTVVPYNLFLHASAVKSRWSGQGDLQNARTDTAISIGLGGLITILVVSTAAASLFGSGTVISGVGDMAKQLEPAFGSFSKYLLGIGLCAAGLSSAISAPLATAYATSEILGFKKGVNSHSFQAIALGIIVVGSGLALTGVKPITIIISAQFANGLLLPIIAGFLLFVMNQKNLLGIHTNSWRSNTLGILVVFITAGLGLRSITKAMGIF